MKSLIREREKARHGLHREDRGAIKASRDSRYIPARIKAEVYARDHAQCAFVTDDGVRCTCNADLEYDHIQPRAHGGPSTADNLRLLCPAHNQYEAERNLGRTFMEQKRANPEPLLNHARKQDDFEGAEDVKAALITLGYRKDAVITALEYAAGLPATLSAPERVKAILKRALPD